MLFIPNKAWAPEMLRWRSPRTCNAWLLVTWKGGSELVVTRSQHVRNLERYCRKYKNISSTSPFSTSSHISTYGTAYRVKASDKWMRLRWKALMVWRVRKTVNWKAFKIFIHHSSMFAHVFPSVTHISTTHFQNKTSYVPRLEQMGGNPLHNK